MSIIHYTARAKSSRLLELPEEARALGLKPGDEVKISVDQAETATNLAISFGEEALPIMRQLAQRHKLRRITSSSATQRLLQAARGGAE